MELFGPRPDAAPAVLELLRSPWIVRGSELPSGDADGPRRLDEPVEVEWDPESRRPSVFVRDGHVYRVDAVVQVWAVERSWWSPAKRASRRCFRVLAESGVYDLAYDRMASRWILLGVSD